MLYLIISGGEGGGGLLDLGGLLNTVTGTAGMHEPYIFWHLELRVQ